MPVTPHLSWVRLVRHAVLGAAVILLAAYLIAWRWIGTSEATALLRGDEIALLPNKVDLGECAPGDARELQFQVKNFSSAPVTLTGMYTSCSCILASSLPVKLKAYETSNLRMTIHASGEGQFNRQAVLYTDSHITPQISIEITGRVLPTVAAELEPVPQSVSAVAIPSEP